MSLAVRVKDGTSAGIRRPFEGRPAEWVCACGYDIEIVVQPGHLRRCPKCGARRPDLAP